MAAARRAKSDARGDARAGTGAKKKRGARGPRRSSSAARHRSSGGRVALFFAIALLVPFLCAALFWLTLPDVTALQTHFPESTALIDARAEEARASGRAARKMQHVVPLAHISHWLMDAVVDSEDARFFLHKGVDLVETKAALKKAVEEHKLGRGASTLTQQLAKNLWLGEERSLFRKGRELLMAWRLESLGKERILELYLNEVEWGDGIYGVEAAAQHWFGIHAKELSPEQSAVLAAMLPAPRKRNPRRPSKHLKQRAAQVLELFGMYNQLNEVELASARERLRALLGG